MLFLPEQLPQRVFWLRNVTLRDWKPKVSASSANLPVKNSAASCSFICSFGIFCCFSIVFTLLMCLSTKCFLESRKSSANLCVSPLGTVTRTSPQCFTVIRKRLALAEETNVTSPMSGYSITILLFHRSYKIKLLHICSCFRPQQICDST